MTTRFCTRIREKDFLANLSPSISIVMTVTFSVALK
jgi:hypothetical protein